MPMAPSHFPNDDDLSLSSAKWHHVVSVCIHTENYIQCWPWYPKGKLLQNWSMTKSISFSRSRFIWLRLLVILMCGYNWYKFASIICINSTVEIAAYTCFSHHWNRVVYPFSVNIVFPPTLSVFLKALFTTFLAFFSYQHSMNDALFYDRKHLDRVL